MKRVVGISLLLTIIALSCLANMASPAFAATNRASVATRAQTSINRARAARRDLQTLPAWRYPQQRNQFFAGNSDSFRSSSFWGHDQRNTGNQGVNWGIIQDNSSSTGNFMSGF